MVKRPPVSEELGSSVRASELVTVKVALDPVKFMPEELNATEDEGIIGLLAEFMGRLPESCRPSNTKAAEYTEPFKSAVCNELASVAVTPPEDCIDTMPVPDIPLAETAKLIVLLPLLDVETDVRLVVTCVDPIFSKMPPQEKPSKVPGKAA